MLLNLTKLNSWSILALLDRQPRLLFLLAYLVQSIADVGSEKQEAQSHSNDDNRLRTKLSKDGSNDRANYTHWTNDNYQVVV